MTFTPSPFSKDYSNLEFHDEDGELLDLSDQEAAALAKIPRLKRDRGRIRKRGTLQWTKWLKNHVTGETVFDESDTYEYPGDAEVTIDTVRNPTLKPVKVPKGKIIDDGGDFTHTTVYMTGLKTGNYYRYNKGEVYESYASGQVWLETPGFIHLGINVSDSTVAPEEDYDLSGIGPGLWNAMLPTNPGVDLGINIAELRDLPRLVKDKLDSLKSVVSSLSNPKGLADWVLAINFGWKPLLSDIRKVINLYFKLERKVDFLLRNGGKPLHRRLPTRAPEITNEVLFEYSGPVDQGWVPDRHPESSDPDGEVPDRFKCKIELRKSVYTNASGVFVYYLGDIPPTKAYLRLKLLGLIPSESLLWEATRWSWLVDWFSNMGDVLSNIEAKTRDNAVSIYAYAQRRVVREYKFTYSNGFYDVGFTRVYDTKCRRKIDPFGLAGEVSLTDLQLGILLALGITRS